MTEREWIARAQKLAVTASAHLGCGDNSCAFMHAGSPKGMRTNGGCRCEVKGPSKAALAALFRAVMAPVE